MSWLKNLLKQHEEYESPRAFWHWAALASISAVVKDNVYWDKFLYKLYPNIYVMFHADSGMKKGPPINMAKQLVRHVNNTRIISGRSSIQGILKKLGTAETKPGGQIVKGSTGFICSSELASSIVEDKQALTILTDLYDRSYNAGEWESLLKMEVFTLKDATVTMLAGINDAHSQDLFLKKDIQGGYFARTFIIYESKSQSINSLMYQPKEILNYEKSAEYLKELSKLTGKLEVELDTRKYFDNWYQVFKQGLITNKIKDPTGTLNRFDDSVLKVAILTSLGNVPEPKISMEAVVEAIDLCEKLVGNVRKVTMGSGSRNGWAIEKALVIKELVEREPHMIIRQQLIKKFWHYANANTWNEIIETLESAGVLKVETHGNTVMYVMPDNIAMEWKQHLEGK